MGKPFSQRRFFGFFKVVSLYVLGVLLTYFINLLNAYGYFAIWQRLPMPPENAVALLNASLYPDALFIKTTGGHVYSLNLDQKINWVLVREQVDATEHWRCYPDRSTSRYDVYSEHAFLLFRDQIADCLVVPQVFENVLDDFVFVLLKDGTIYQWHNQVGLHIWVPTFCIIPLVTMIAGLILLRNVPE